MQTYSTSPGSSRFARRKVSRSRFFSFGPSTLGTAFLCLSVLFFSQPSLAQEIYSLPAGPISPRQTPPSELLPPESRTGESRSERVASKVELATRSKQEDGATFVALASGLQAVFDGREPSTLQELKALELQQSRVAKAIESVTVNVQQGAAQGSGVIITADGYVLTAAHVAGNHYRDAIIVLNDGTQVRAKTLGMNRDKDAGLMKIEDSRYPGPWPYASIGRSSDLREGQWCVASGHPGGWKPERGSVIRVGRVLKISKNRGESEAHTLFTDCALIGGDSGGPLFTLEGKLIGIHSRIGTDVVDNMHVPIDVFASSWDRMKRGDVWGMLPGYQPIIGVNGTKHDDRPLIASVIPGGPAEKAGLQAGDLILTFDGVRLRTFADLRENVEATMPGDVITLTIERSGQQLRLPITIGVAE